MIPLGAVDHSEIPASGGGGGTHRANLDGGRGADPYASCEGINFSRLGLTASQVSRIHKLYRRQGRSIGSCTHDLAKGASAEDLAGGDGPYETTKFPTIAGPGGYAGAAMGVPRPGA